MLPRHALLQAEGACVESFYPGVEAIGTLQWQDRLALAQILGKSGRIAVDSLAKDYGPRCLPLLSGRAASVAIQHHCGEMAGISAPDPALPVRIDRQMPLF